MTQEEKIQDLEQQLDKITTIAAEQVYNIVKILSVAVSCQERNYEGSHSHFVSQKSVEVARILGMDETEIFEIEAAGLLHDIGKIALSPAINKKFQTEMTRQEFELYQKHPIIAQRMLSYSPQLDNIGKIILQHHERLDGSGFPKHLQGKEILPGAAIIAVVDAYHNLFYKISTKNKLAGGTPVPLSNNSLYIESTQNKYNNAIKYLFKYSGISFDTKVVDIFTDLIYKERKAIGGATVMRVQLNKLEPGWIFADDYFSSNGLLLAARGETITPNIKKTLLKLAEHGELPLKIVIMKP